MADWQATTTGLGFGGYADWEAALSEATGDNRPYVSVFFRLRPETPGMSLRTAIDATLAADGVLFSQHERDLLATEFALAPDGWPHEVRCVAFCRRAAVSGLPACWEVLKVGPGLAPDAAEAPQPAQDLCRTAGHLERDVPVVAVIDDGIGFLNARFRKNRDESRILAVWLQAAERAARGTGPRVDIVSGRVLDRAEIEAHLASLGDEAEVYRQVNKALLPTGERAMTNRRVAHGTHVLDLAAGADPWNDDPLRDVPILAVQLPPAAIRDTAGRRLEAHLVQGLRWILAEVLRRAHGTDAPPVIVNLSLGSLAGPGDRTAFLADWLRYEIARHHRMTGGEVRIVIAYGNARLSRLAARGELRLSAPMTLHWRVLPDDHSSSFQELRVDRAMTGGLRLKLTPPAASGLPALDAAWPEPGKGWMLTDGGGPFAAGSSVAEPGEQAFLLLALGPTAEVGGLPACPPGDWQVELRTTEAEPVRLIAQVQRDDTPPGYRTLGRQSWLDHPESWHWDEALRGYLAPRAQADAPGCPITREGTCVAYAGASHPHILFVGSVRPVIGAPDAVEPAPYSAEGARHLRRAGESSGPTLTACGDDGVMLPGRIAAGVVSGSVARLSGTSMAAPLVTRALARYFLATPPDQRTEAAERRALSGHDQWQEPDPRLGHGTLASG